MATTPSGIAYDQAGDTGLPAVVLIHAGVADRRMWDPQWEALSGTHHVVRLDLRGFGDSTTPPEGALANVDDVLETLDHLGVESCHLVGASMGSGVAVEVALTAPGLVRSLTLCPPGGSLFPEVTDELRSFWRAEGEALEAGDLDAAAEANVETWVVGQGRDADDVDPAVRDAVRRMQRRVFEVTAPTLVLVGGHDLGATHSSADRLSAGLPHARRVDWPDVAHLPSMEQPERFLELLGAWLTEQGGD